MLNKLTHASTLRVEIEGFKKTARSQPNKKIQEKVLKLFMFINPDINRL